MNFIKNRKKIALLLFSFFGLIQLYTLLSISADFANKTIEIINSITIIPFFITTVFYLLSSIEKNQENENKNLKYEIIATGILSLIFTAIYIFLPPLQ